MKISTQTDYYMQNGYSFKEIVTLLKDAGFDCIDFSFFSIPEERLMNDSALAGELQEMKEYADSLGMTFNQAHAPFPSSVSDEKRDGEIFHMIVRSMELASILGVRQIVVHPKIMFTYKGNEERLEKINYDFYMALLPYCMEYKVKIAIENMWEYDKLRKCIIPSICAYADEHAHYVDRMDSEWFVACLDVGHCALVGEDVVHSIHTLGHDRLKSLHIHDVDYLNDKHTLPGVEKLDFTKIAEALKEIQYDGELTLEADNFLRGFETGFVPVAAKFMADRARFIADMAG